MQPGGGYDGRLLHAFSQGLVVKHAFRPHPKSKLFIPPPQHPRMAGQPDLTLIDLHFDPWSLFSNVTDKSISPHCFKDYNITTLSRGKTKGTFSDSPQGSHRDGFLHFHFPRNETKLAYSLRTLRQPEPHKNFWKGQIDSRGLPKEQFDATPCLHYPGHCSISIKAFHSPRCPPSSRQMEVQWHWFIYRGPNELFSGSSASGGCDLITSGEMKSSPRA